MTGIRILGLMLVPFFVGCLPLQQQPLGTVKPNALAPLPAPKLPKQFEAKPANKEEALRVDIVAQKLIQANRETGLRPVLHTIGCPTPELFHRDVEALYITEGLTKKCTTEAQLAAVVAFELGRMVAEREALASPAVRKPDRPPPLEARVGNDAGGPFGPAEGVKQFELAQHEKAHPRRPSKVPTPDPTALARSYLEKAGYPAQAFDEVAPLLKQARGQFALERQMIGG